MVGQKKFSLIKDRNAITLTVPEMVITINENNEVRVNNTPVSLPVQSQSKRTRVTLVGDTVEVESDIGIALKVIGEKKLCVVEVTTALWGDVSGILGTNDNDASNDWKMPSGKQASHAEEFLNSYEVSKAPQCKLVKGGAGGRQCGKSNKCQQLFGGSGASPLKQCFQVNIWTRFRSGRSEFRRKLNRENKKSQPSVSHRFGLTRTATDLTKLGSVFDWVIGRFESTRRSAII